MLWGLFLPGWKMVLGLQGGNMIKVLNNSVLTVLFGTTGTRARLYEILTPDFC